MSNNSPPHHPRPHPSHRCQTDAAQGQLDTPTSELQELNNNFFILLFLSVSKCMISSPCSSLAMWYWQNYLVYRLYLCLYNYCTLYVCLNLCSCLIHKNSILQWVSVLAPPTRSAHFWCLSYLTHLIQIINLLEESSMHELCSNWQCHPYMVFTAPYSLRTGNLFKFTLHLNIHSGLCGTQCLHTQTKLTREVWIVT